MGISNCRCAQPKQPAPLPAKTVLPRTQRAILLQCAQRKARSAGLSAAIAVGYRARSFAAAYPPQLATVRAKAQNSAATAYVKLMQSRVPMMFESVLRPTALREQALRHRKACAHRPPRCAPKELRAAQTSAQAAQEMKLPVHRSNGSDYLQKATRTCGNPVSDWLVATKSAHRAGIHCLCQGCHRYHRGHTYFQGSRASPSKIGELYGG